MSFLYVQDFEPSSAHQRREVSEDGQGGARNTDVRQGQEGHTRQQGVNRNTSLVDALEDLGGLSLHGKLEKSSRSDIHIRIGGRENEEENAAVDECRQELDTSKSNGDNERAGGGVGGAVQIDGR